MYEPDYYVNMHCGAGPYAAYYRSGNYTISENIRNKMNQISQEEGIAPYRVVSFGSRGFSIGDAVTMGVKSAWLIECEGKDTAWRHLPENYEELENIYFPKCLAQFRAIS